MHSVLTLQTPRLSDYGELVQVWEDSVRATHDFLPDCYIVLLREQVLLSGNGLRLDFADGQRVELEPPFQRSRFSGERELLATPVDGPVQAFNLIWRPSVLEVELLHRPLVGGMFCFADADTAWALHLLGGCARIDGDEGSHELAGGDSAWLASARRRRFAIEGAGEALLMRVTRADGA